MKRLSQHKDNIFYGWVIIGNLLIILAMLLGTLVSYGVFFKKIRNC